MTYEAKVMVPAEVISLLRNEPKIVLETNIANAWRDVDIEFLGLMLGTNRLPPLLRAIERQSD
jgi:hypothetical protein